MGWWCTCPRASGEARVNDGTRPVIVAGAGHAAGQVLVALRKEGYAGPLVLVGEEPQLPYQRPPLSKAYLAGKVGFERLQYRAPQFYAEQHIDTRLGRPAVAIDRAARTLTLHGGDTLAYERLVLATGARVRTLAVPGAGCEGVHYLRTLADSDALRARLGTAGAVLVIGGGFIGLEVAAVCRELGKTVTVLETQDRLLARVVSPAVSAFFRAVHEERGVEVITGAQVAAIETGERRPLAVRDAAGRRFEADLVVVGIGVVPNTELACAAGLECEDGIVVDQYARTSDPHIVAAGDCTRFPNPLLGLRLRLESVHNAVEQANTAAATLCGRERPYAQVPWFWSDQYDLVLQMAGISAGHDQEVLRGDPDARRFSMYYYKSGRLVAIDSINRPVDHMLGRKLLTAGVTPTPAQAADPSFDLKTLL